MTKTIQNGRYKIRRSQDQESVIISAGSANSVAILAPDDYPGVTGIWILTIDPSNPPSTSVALEGAVSATLQHEHTKAYLTLDNPNSPLVFSSILVSSDAKQVWTINPAISNEYHIVYPNLVDEEVLVVDNSLEVVYPRRMALRDFDNDMTFPWRFEPVV
ncbi:hypothetical protein KI688_011100 [Linnemannia hyalina]|uniref:Uncharacterized protein n=1 Tax=Linnemannia hyalina TaxID=64524 RepID=A0A9P8BU06_9FUNG|nr:hypothetical protein KI688_011100 [Linnemannia hyalina]